MASNRVVHMAETRAIEGGAPTARTRRSPKIRPVPAALLALTLAGCGSGSVTGSATSSTPAAAPQRATPVGVSAGQLHAVASSAGHPVFWAGAAAGTYELTTIADGRTYIRYLPPGTSVGSSHRYLTIGTYVLPSSPYDTVHKAAITKHAVIKTLNKTGALAVQYRVRPQSVYLVFPGAKYEVEVYDPSASAALRIATTGKIVPIP
jgi:hypothetical protein